MATAYNPGIVTSGLVVCLDAGNAKSYPGSGTTWTDLSGNSNSVTLQNSPTYSANNGGFFNLNGTNQYASGTNNSIVQITGNLTISAWVNLGDNADQGIFEKMNSNPYSGYGITKQSGYFKFWTAASNSYAYTISNTTYTSNSNWFFVTGVRTSGVNRLYVNDVLQNDSQSPPFADSGDAFVLGRYYGAVNNYYAVGKIAFASLYNVSLTADQVLQNYNALRGRFGL